MFPKNCQEWFIFSAWKIDLVMAALFFLKNKDRKGSKSLILEALRTTKNNVKCETLNKGVYGLQQYTYSEVYSFSLSATMETINLPMGRHPFGSRKVQDKESWFCYASPTE